MIQIQLDTTKVNVWHLMICGNKCAVTTQKVVSNPEISAFSSALCLADGSFYLLDVCGNVYTVNLSIIFVLFLPNCRFKVNQDMEPERIIEFKEKGKGTTTFTWLKGGLFVAGPNCQLRVIFSSYSFMTHITFYEFLVL